MYWTPVHCQLRLVEIVSEEARRSRMYTPPSWPSGRKSTAAEIYNGLMQAVPNTKGTAVFIESTANGVTGLFYDLWKGAVEGTNGYVPVFIPWYVDPEYREPVPDNFERHQKKKTWSRSSASMTSSSCSAGARSRRTASICGTRNTLQNRRPGLSHDRPPCVQSRAAAGVHRRRTRSRRTPSPRSRRMGSEPPRRANNLPTIRPRRTICRGSGRGYGGHQWRLLGRSSTRLQKRQVATWRGQVHPDYFAEVLYALGMEYNEALVIVENNSHGILTCTRLGRTWPIRRSTQKSSTTRSLTKRA